jgi:hypothetical protein
LRWAQRRNGGEERLVRGGVIGFGARLEGGEDGRASFLVHHCETLQPADDLEDFPSCVSGRLVVLGDKGYLGEDDIRTPYRGRNKPASQKEANRLMPGCAPLASAPMPSSSSGASCANSAAARGAPGSWPRRSTSCTPAKTEDEKAH